MGKSIYKRNWWIVLVVAGILAGAVTLIQKYWLPGYEVAAFIITMVILGIAFYWVYSIDKEGLWWALIPALAMLTLLVTAFVAGMTDPDPTGSSPYGVVTLGLGAAMIGIVLKRPKRKSDTIPQQSLVVKSLISRQGRGG